MDDERHSRRRVFRLSVLDVPAPRRRCGFRKSLNVRYCREWLNLEGPIARGSHECGDKSSRYLCSCLSAHCGSDLDSLLLLVDPTGTITLSELPLKDDLSRCRTTPANAAKYGTGKSVQDFVQPDRGLVTGLLSWVNPYVATRDNDAPGVTRTRGQQFRKLLLYPPELRGRWQLRQNNNAPRHTNTPSS